MAKHSTPFPEEGKFPSGEEFSAYVKRSLKELGISAYKVAQLIPGNTNNNIVREIATGAQVNPTARTMKQIFDAIEGVRRQQAAKDTGAPE
ncbi:helix-turn-helix domain-containing protein [Leisingera sp. ANG-M7]|uniref:helix-turn-helix domain-containing protein n=1 Tax=Leisingera sp. ANG-M7 TaxID=1577902 RepID=UPI00057D6E31|nr:hypothetical protein [Leisingera sp. ANG-M7]KIC36528.1 hypothetical protein RA26_12385 [Leisingera sp. ANG-M7]